MSEPAVIPIQNLYYLLCYAWDRLDQSHVIDVSAFDCPTPVDLFASLLIKGTEHLQRRGLNMGYQFQDAEIASIRGKIDILKTERRLLLQHARAPVILMSSPSIPCPIASLSRRFVCWHQIRTSIGSIDLAFTGC
jgi:5-methylcytosine-specific restriction endonuclease McrBC regulatory subunit McrC